MTCVVFRNTLQTLLLPQHHHHHTPGELEMWNKAEAALEEALNASGREWVLNPEDGAFYGPKIDITGGSARSEGAGCIYREMAHQRDHVRCMCAASVLRALPEVRLLTNCLRVVVLCLTRLLCCVCLCCSV